MLCICLRIVPSYRFSLFPILLRTYAAIPCNYVWVVSPHRLLSRTLYKEELEPQWPSPDKVRTQDAGLSALLWPAVNLYWRCWPKACGQVPVCIGWTLHTQYTTEVTFQTVWSPLICLVSLLIVHCFGHPHSHPHVCPVCSLCLTPSQTTFSVP